MRYRFVLFVLFAALGSCVSHQQPPPTNTHYVRADWPHWIDSNGDCRNTRAELLLAHSSVDVSYRDTRRCTVASGRWFDEYTGKTLSQASQVDIDHIVPLAWAHGRGGSAWSRAQKQRFANDPGNLIPASSSANRAKGSRGPDAWLPPRQAYRCEYLRHFDRVVRQYRLQYLPQETRSIRQLLSHCRANPS